MVNSGVGLNWNKYLFTMIYYTFKINNWVFNNKVFWDLKLETKVFKFDLRYKDPLINFKILKNLFKKVKFNAIILY